MKNNNISLVQIIYVVIIILLFCFLYKFFFSINEKEISKLTDDWINAVTIDNDPQKISSLFCSDGNLIATVSQVKRKGNDIKLYFNYFAKLPGIKVISKKYNISKVTYNVFINTAFITWDWDELDEPITARMTFLFRDTCIFQLHSSILPEINENLLKISNLS
jgi:hypothetical protein